MDNLDTISKLLAQQQQQQMTILAQQQQQQREQQEAFAQQQQQQQQAIMQLLQSIASISVPAQQGVPPATPASLMQLRASSNDTSLARIPRVIVPSQLVTDFATQLDVDIDTFLMQMHEVLIRAGATTNEMKLAFVADFLQGRSNRWWWTTRRSANIDTWDAFAAALRIHASDGGIREARLTTFEELQQQPGQTDREWKLALLDAHNLIPPADQLTAEQLARKYRMKARASISRTLNAWVADPARRNATIDELSEYAINLNLPLSTTRWHPRKPGGGPPTLNTLSPGEKTQQELTRAAAAKIKEAGIVTLNDLRDHGVKVTVANPYYSNPPFQTDCHVLMCRHHIKTCSRAARWRAPRLFSYLSNDHSTLYLILL